MARKEDVVNRSPQQEPAEMQVPVDRIDRDPQNRDIVEDERFTELVDAIRALGIIESVKLVEVPGGRYQLFDGERRWLAAQRAGLTALPAKVWPIGTDTRWLIEVGLALHETREQPGCLHVARRLRQLKNQHAETPEQIAARTGIPLRRVRSYVSLFESSDFLLSFFEDHDVPLYQAVEFVRYEATCGEAAARALARRYMEQPLSQREIIAERKKRTPVAAKPDERRRSAESASGGLAGRIETAFQRDQARAIAELEAVLTKLGYRLVREGARPWVQGQDPGNSSETGPK